MEDTVNEAQDRTVHVALCADNNYAMPAGVMIQSVCRHTQGVMFHMIVSDGFTLSNRERIKKITDSFGAGIEFINRPQGVDDLFPVGLEHQAKHISTAAYYRLMLAVLLPPDIDRVLYLDCDLICMRPLEELWNTDISGMPLAAVQDIPFSGISEARRLGYDERLGYFNSGVLLVNLDYWRRNNVFSQFKDILASIPEKLQCHDQDVLNMAFKGTIHALPPKFNAVDFLFSTIERPMPYSVQETVEAVHNPVIVHFTYYRKPWIKGYSHPYRKAFLDYKKATPWRCTPLKCVKPENLKGLLSNILVRLGLHKYSNGDYISLRTTTFK